MNTRNGFKSFCVSFLSEMTIIKITDKSTFDNVIMVDNKNKQSIEEVMKESKYLPILIFSNDDKSRLLGILTMFDLL